MEKVNKSIAKEYPPVKIYKNDLEAIIALFDENQIKYTISTTDYKYSDISEFFTSQDGKCISSLFIKTSEPYLTIEFHKMWTKLYISSDETFTTGLFHKLDSILNQSRRVFSFAYKNSFTLLLSFFLPIVVYPGGKFLSYKIAISIGAIMLIWLLRATYVSLVKHSSIQIVRKEHVSGFFKRKKDDLMLAFISALIGAILGIIGTILTNKYIH